MSSDPEGQEKVWAKVPMLATTRKKPARKVCFNAKTPMPLSGLAAKRKILRSKTRRCRLFPKPSRKDRPEFSGEQQSSASNGKYTGSPKKKTKVRGTI
jgi:hypothetical protein